MGDQHDRGAPRQQGLQRVGEHLLALHVDARRRLVEHQQVFADALRHPGRRAAPRSCWSPTSSARSAPLVDRAVVMRDGRMAYDGPPIDRAVTDRRPAHAHDHHHADLDRSPGDHAPTCLVARWTGEERR